MSSPMSTCLQVCQQDCKNPTEWISTELGLRMGLGPEYPPLTCGAEPDTGMDPGHFFFTIFYIANFFRHFHLFLGE